MLDVLQPEGWSKPIGYSNGMAGKGRLVFIAGQIGWNAACQFETDEFGPQLRQTLQNVVDVLAAGGGRPEHIASMTWYVVDKKEYLASLKEVGRAWREIMGRHFPAMAVVQVSGLVEDRARIEIQAHAILPD